jgi:hypothetical protein
MSVKDFCSNTAKRGTEFKILKGLQKVRNIILWTDHKQVYMFETHLLLSVFGAVFRIE